MQVPTNSDGMAYRHSIDEKALVKRLDKMEHRIDDAHRRIGLIFDKLDMLENYPEIMAACNQDLLRLTEDVAALKYGKDDA